MYLKLSAAVTALALSRTSLAATKEKWRGRSVYQVLTDRFALTNGSTTAPCNTGDRVYCGGTFKGIQNQLDYIQGMGFDAVWISPVTAQIRGTTPYGEAYHGYWQQDIFSINSHFGTGDDLLDLSNALHDREMYMMLDVVVNHYGCNGDPSSIDYSTFKPFNSSSQYHPYCPIDFDDITNSTQLEQCWSGDTNVSLPDLRTEDTDVATQWNDWIANMISTYKLDGLRLDSAIEVDPDFWQGFGDAAGAYFVGETYNEDVNFVCDFQNYMPGVMDYPTYFPLLAAFSSTPASDDTLMNSLADTINAVKASCKDTTIKGTFTENHDRPRIASVNPDLSAAKNMVVYTLLADGIPIIYQGQEQHHASVGGADDPYNREALWLSGYDTSSPLYKLLGTLNAARKAAIADDAAYLTYQNWPIYNDTTTIAMRKGRMITVLSNKGENGDAYTQVIPAGYAAGTKMTEILSCSTLTADGEGGINVPMEAGLPRVYYLTAGLSGSSICAAKKADDDDAGSATSGGGRSNRSGKWHSVRRHLHSHQR